MIIINIIIIISINSIIIIILVMFCLSPSFLKSVLPPRRDARVRAPAVRPLGASGGGAKNIV